MLRTCCPIVTFSSISSKALKNIMVDQNIKKLYYSISEVSNLTGLKQYVLRYWETEFSELKPKKNKAGNRTYRQSDIDIVVKIKNLLYTQKYTIEGARDRLKFGDKLINTNENNSNLYLKVLKDIKSQLYTLLKSLED